MSRSTRRLPVLLFSVLLSCPLALPLQAQAAEHKAKKAAVVKKKARKAAAPVQRDKPGHAFGKRADLMHFAEALATAQGWSVSELQGQLAQAQSLPVVQRLVMPAPAGVAKDWAAYRARFIEPRRLKAGLAFWEDNEAALNEAQERFGVPAELIVGLIGVETFYGRIMGGFRVVDALATLGFDFPTGRSDRSEFFRGELAELLKLCHREGRDPFSVKGSYAGAIGLPQFMPGSWNRHAIDFNGDGHVDLIDQPADAIGSVANYLAAHGWKRGMPTHYTLTLPVSPTEQARLLAPDIKPTFSSTELQAAGAELSQDARDHPGPLAVIELHNGNQSPSYALGTENFYALTRYNWSAYYAMAVIELGRGLASMRQASH